MCTTLGAYIHVFDWFPDYYPLYPMMSFEKYDPLELTTPNYCNMSLINLVKQVEWEIGGKTVLICEPCKELGCMVTTFYDWDFWDDFQARRESKVQTRTASPLSE